MYTRNKELDAKIIKKAVLEQLRKKERNSIEIKAICQLNEVIKQFQRLGGNIHKKREVEGLRKEILGIFLKDEEFKVDSRNEEVSRTLKYPHVTNYSSLIKEIDRHREGLALSEVIFHTNSRNIKDDIQKGKNNKLIKRYPSKKEEYLFPCKMENQYSITEEAHEHYNFIEFYLPICREVFKDFDLKDNTKKSVEKNSRTNTKKCNWYIEGYEQDKQEWKKKQKKSALIENK